MIKLLNFYFIASVSGLGIGFQVILKKWSKKKITYTPPLIKPLNKTLKIKMYNIKLTSFLCLFIYLYYK